MRKLTNIEKFMAHKVHSEMGRIIERDLEIDIEKEMSWMIEFLNAIKENDQPTKPKVEIRKFASVSDAQKFVAMYNSYSLNIACNFEHKGITIFKYKENDRVYLTTDGRFMTLDEIAKENR